VITKLVDMIADVRVLSGLRSNPSITDAQIAKMLTDAWLEKYDTYVKALQHWFRAAVPFTLSGNTATTNQFDLTSIPTINGPDGLPLPPFQMDQGLNFWPSGTIGSGSAVTVQRLGSFAERNQFGTGVPGLGLGFGGSLTYFTNGDTLYVQPFQQSAGAYELIYTPQAAGLALPTTLLTETASIPISTAGSNVSFSSTAFLDAVSAPWIPTDAGGNVVVTGAANPGNNGPHSISSYVSATRLTLVGTYTPETLGGGATVTLLRASRVDTSGNWTLYGDTPTNNASISVKAGDLLTTTGAVNPSNNGTFVITEDATGGITVKTAGAVGLVAENLPSLTFSATVQPYQTISVLPQVMSPWVLYLKIHAAIAIKESRNQVVTDLERKLTAQTARIVAMAKQRSEGKTQAPITNWRRRRGPLGYWT
jgi:hypothetical protein